MIAMAAMFFSAAASAGSGGFFFDSGTQAPSPRAAFQTEQREQILADAYACNRVGQPPDEVERCKAREAAVKQAIMDRVVANHQAAEPQRREMRRLYERMSPLQR
jgi:Spy/CpxP family protein refolding chaperone